MVHYIKGNLLESEAQALVNTVNTEGVMGKGIALQFKEAFPSNFKIYRKACKDKSFTVGQMLVTTDATLFGDSKLIINFPTKTSWRLPSEYSYISSGLSALRDEIINRGIKSIAIPPLGSHNGGLDWNKVKPMIIEALNDLDCDVYLYEPSDVIIEKMKSERVSLSYAKAMLIRMLGDLTDFGEYATIFAAEKLVYFLQRFGAKRFFKINFEPYIYGPYSAGKISHLLYDLNGSYIKGMEAMENKPFEMLWLMEDADQQAIDFLQSKPDLSALDICNQTISFLRTFYSTLSLELLSTTDYILANTSSLKGWQNDSPNDVRDRVLVEIRKMSARKENLMTPESVEIAINHLRLAPFYN